MRLLLLVGLLAYGHAVDWDTRMPIDDYIALDDGHYSYDIIRVDRFENESTNVYVVNMTSQKWMDETYCDHPIWWHWMRIAVPDNPRYNDGAFLFIGGGSNRNPDNPPSEDDAVGLLMANVALDTGSVAAYLEQIPNQPIVFVDDPEQRRRSEDAQIAFAWATFYMDNGTTPEKLSRFPMTKACVKAMDTANSVARQQNSNHNLTRWMVAGGSKRGWTAWMLAATDRRVAAAAPMVMSLLNWRADMMHHYRSYGGWSFAFGDYYEIGLTRELDNPLTELLFTHVDPYNYKERLTMPKLVVSATGDEFFHLEDSHYWWDDMPEPIYFMMNDNTHHSLFPWYLKIYENCVSFFLAVMEGVEMPHLRWTMHETATQGSIVLTVDSDHTPNRIQGNVAITNRANATRDFRHLYGNPPTLQLVPWEETTVEDLGSKSWRVEVPKVEGQWVGMQMEVRFDGVAGLGDWYHYFTTEVNVIPKDEYVVPECAGEACYGTLV